jgi:hypothetical protein
MSCSGLHCAGCGGGGGAGAVVVLAAFEGVEWIAAHVVEVIAVSATCGVLAVAAVIALFRWADRRDARYAVERPFVIAREIPGVSPTAVPSAERPALGFRDLHIHLDSVPSAEQAAVIRQALNGWNNQS